MFNIPSIAGAVLQTPFPIINLITDLSYVCEKYSPHVTCVKTFQNSWAYNSPLKIALNVELSNLKIPVQDITNYLEGDSCKKGNMCCARTSKYKVEPSVRVF